MWKYYRDDYFSIFPSLLSIKAVMASEAERDWFSQLLDEIATYEEEPPLDDTDSGEEDDFENCLDNNDTEREC